MENKPLPALPPVICVGSNSSFRREWVVHPDGRRNNMGLTDWDNQYQIQGECVGEDVPVASSQTGGTKPSFSQFMKGIWPESDAKKQVPSSVPPAADSATSQKHPRAAFLNRRFPGFKPSLIRTMPPTDSLPASIDDMDFSQHSKPQMSRTPSITSTDSCSFSFAPSVRHTQASCTTTASHLHDNSIFSFEIDGKDELSVDVSLWKTMNEEYRSSAPEPPSLASSTSIAAFTRRRQFSFANTSSPSPSFSRSLSARSEMSNL